MRNFTLGIILFILPAILSCGGEDPCYGDRTGSYFPINIDDRLRYHSEAIGYESRFTGDSTEFNGNYYYVNIKEFENGNVIEEYWRKDKDGAVLFYSPEDDNISIEISAIREPGHSWENHQGTWTYEIRDTAATYSTPNCEFTDLLKVRANVHLRTSPQEPAYYNLYYKRGVGLVALTREDEPHVYLLPKE